MALQKERTAVPALRRPGLPIPYGGSWCSLTYFLFYFLTLMRCLELAVAGESGIIQSVWCWEFIC